MNKFARQAAIVGIFSMSAVGSIGSAPRITDLVNQSDLIAIGEITSIKLAGTTFVDVQGTRIQAKSMQGQMAVDWVLKGPHEPSGLNFSFPIPEVGIGYHGVQEHTYRIIFLKLGDRGYEFTSPDYPSFVAVPGMKPGGRTVYDQVLEEACAALQSQQLPAGARAEVLDQVKTVDNAQLTAALHQALDQARQQKGDEGLEYSLVAELLRRNDIRVLAFAESKLLSPERVSVPKYLVTNLAYAIVGIKEGDGPAVGARSQTFLYLK